MAGKKDVVWFALSSERPLCAFAETQADARVDDLSSGISKRPGGGLYRLRYRVFVGAIFDK
jgi:hypothetical protein